jgi:hypothetical protein
LITVGYTRTPAGPGAFQGCDGAGKTHGVSGGRLLRQTDRQRTVENVARPRGINHVDLKARLMT